MSNPQELARPSAGLLKAAASGCRHLFPVLAVLNPALGALLALVDAGMNIAADMDADYVKNEIDALKRLVGRVEQRVMDRCEWTEERAQEVLRRPDVLKLLAEARDVYALAQYESRLDRFADVIAGRAPRSEDDLEPDIRLARAAIELTDAGVEMLRSLVQRRAAGLYYDAPPRLDGPPEHRSIVGETALGALLRTVEPSSASAGASQLDALRVLDAHGLAMHTKDLVAGTGIVGCADRAHLLYRAELWVATDRGAAFIALVAARVSVGATSPAPATAG